MSAAALTDGVYATSAILVLWLGLLVLWSRLRPGPTGAGWKLTAGAAALALALLPVQGVALWRWGLGVFPNPSMPLLGLVGAALVARLTGVRLLTESDRRDAWWLGALAGCVLYPHAWGLWPFDLYFWGWRRELWIWSLALLVLAFALVGRRTGVLVLLALVGHALDLLESDNGWDYLVDPVYWLVGVAVAARAALNRRGGGRGSDTGSPRGDGAR